MNESSSMPTLNNSSDFPDTSNSKSRISDIPPLPKKKQSQRTFIKGKKVNTNPLLIPLEMNEQQDNESNVINPTETEALADKKESSGFQQLELKILKPNKHVCNGYLTPADPPTYTESSLPSSDAIVPVIPACGSRRFLKRDTPVLRLDSGVGDGESLQGSGSVKYNRSPPVYSTTSLSNYPLSTQYEQHYEDIDHYNRVNDYQQYAPRNQQSQRNGTDKLPVDKTQSGTNRSLPQLNVLGVTCCDSDDCDHANNTQVLTSISGSLHDPVHTYMHLNTGVSQKSSRTRSDRCRVIFALLVILLISLTALGLSIHNVISNAKHTVSDLDQTIIIMQEKINDLMKEKEAFIMEQKSLTSFVEEKVTQVSSHLQNLSYTLEMVNDRLRTEIANISLTPGPQGLPGIANFSQCVNQSLSTSATASATATTETSFMPSLDEIQKYFVTFAYCTYSGATDAYLETQFDSTSTRQRYRCKCWGQVSGVNQTLCKIVILMCPQES